MLSLHGACHDVKQRFCSGFVKDYKQLGTLHKKRVQSSLNLRYLQDTELHTLTPYQYYSMQILTVT